MTATGDSDLLALEERLRRGSVDVSRQQVVQLVSAWIAARTPAAVVRFGEGEGRLLAADPADALSVTVARRKVRRQTGVMFPPGEVPKIRALVLDAFDHADVVGIRGEFPFNEEHRAWIRWIENAFEARMAAGRAPAYVSDCLVSIDLGLALGALLAGQRQVSVISCRDLAPVIRSDYGVEDVRVFQVPSQYAKRAVDDDYEARLHDVPIWPDFHSALRAEITVRERGEVFLVGAGVFGKDLCIRVKELGGIALDLGSCLDFMAGKATRGRRVHTTG